MSKKVIKKILICFSIVVVSLFLLVLGTLTYFYNKADLNLDQLTFSNSGIKIFASEYMQDNNSYNVDRKIVNINRKRI